MLSLALVLANLHVAEPAQHPAVEHRGKLGTWYWSVPTSGVNIDEDEDEKVPVLEKPGGRYRPTANYLRSFPPIIRTSGLTSVQVNVDSQGRNIVGDAANEPSMMVDPNDKTHLIVGWRQFDSVTSNFRQAGNGYSLNGGLSWNYHDVFTRGTFRSDPVLVPDSSGLAYYNSLQQTFFTDIFTSSNAGINWTLVGPATGGDKQWMTCDPTAGPGHGFLYQLWSTAGNNYNGRQFSRSTNGGTSWMNPINIPSSPIWGTMDVASTGAVYLCGLTSSNFHFVRSSNAQNSSVTPTFDRSVAVNLGGAIVYGPAVNPEGLMGQAWIATDRSSGLFAGNIYMLCSVGLDTTNPGVVRFVRSTDGGLTWSAPQTLNTDPAGVGTTHWFGTMAVAPSGRIDVVWYDNRANPASNNSALFGCSSYDGGVTWSPNVQMSPYFNPNIGYPQQNKMGDYMQLVADTQGSGLAYAATFNGEEDIWFLRIPDQILMPTNATSATLSPGKLASGSYKDLWTAEGSQLVFKSAYDPQSGGVAGVDATYTLPVSDVGGLSVKVRATTSVATTATAYLWNWKTQNWERKQSMAWPGGTANDATFSFGSGVDQEVYWNRNVRCMIRFTSATLQPTAFTTQVDLMQLLFG